MNSNDNENSNLTTISENNIGISELFDYLKIACQLNDIVTNNSNNEKHKDFEDIIDFEKFVNNPLINRILEQSFKEDENKEGENSIITKGENQAENNNQNYDNGIDKNQRRKSLHCHKLNIHSTLSAKLEEVLNEGLLDPVIYRNTRTNSIGNNRFPNNKTKIGDNIASTSRSSTSSNIDLERKERVEKLSFASTSKSPQQSNENNSHRVKDSSRSGRRKSSIGNSQISIEDKKNDTEIVIHVCDEIKNIAKDFTCSQNLLIHKMGYFAEVTAGQKLEDMDISVHCDIQIFEWLMKWVKKDSNQTDNNEPQLDAINVIPILVSASFLQMEPLLLDCLTFCHSRLSEVVRTTTNLSCLNDSIITRLSAMFTNLELEMVKDKKERITPRLWIKMIQSLCEPEPQALRGHYFSLAGLFRCNKCGKYLTQSSSSYITCISSNVRLNRWGQLISKHSKDTSWQITTYVGVLFKELKSWRKVYWKLWGHCHFLYCCICEMHFPLYQMNWCQYHPENPQFLGPASEGKITGPAGRYPCCGQQAFRYETLPGPNGCQYREHSILIETDRDRAILTLAQIAAEGGCLYDSPPSKLLANNNYEPRWTGISLIPTKCRQGLLPSLVIEDNHSKISRRMRQVAACLADSSSETDASDNIDGKLTNWKISVNSDGCESECSSSSSSQFDRKGHIIRQIKLNGGRYWSREISARSNQDNQRDYEEKIMKQVITMVNRKIGTNMKTSYQKQSTGGTYIRLEAEWKEQLKQKHLTKPKTK